MTGGAKVDCDCQIDTPFLSVAKTQLLLTRDSTEDLFDLAFLIAFKLTSDVVSIIKAFYRLSSGNQRYSVCSTRRVPLNRYTHILISCSSRKRCITITIEWWRKTHNGHPIRERDPISFSTEDVGPRAMCCCNLGGVDADICVAFATHEDFRELGFLVHLGRSHQFRGERDASLLVEL
ncbi:hypothetical protein GQ600_14475 [Phytophthora cactorum]|nr:hypothetical protein GQ600_14475 [Phytophthora cactorum]